MRAAVLALSDKRANLILSALRNGSNTDAVRVGGDGHLSEYDVLVADGIEPEELAAEGPPVVLIERTGRERNSVAGRLHALLPPDYLPEELLACVSAAALGLTVLTEAQARQLPGRRRSVPQEFPDEPLTVRELEVLRMMAGGLGNKELGAQLGISPHTAKFHVAQVLAKLRAGSRAEAVAIGIRRGLVPI